MPSAQSAPGVSVIIATRHRPELLAKAVAAVLAQDYAGQVEVLAVFDQTEPQSELEEQSPDRLVRVLRNERTPGLPGARNSGILAAVHPLLAFCDDDDLWLPGKLDTQVRCLLDSGCSAAVTGIQVRYGDELRMRPIDSQRLRFADLVRDRVTAAHPSTYLADRSFVLDTSGLVDEQIPGGYGEDYDWLLRVARHSDIAVVHRPYVEILWHPGSFFTRRWDTIVEALDYVVDKHPEICGDARGYARILGQQAFALAALGRRKESWAKVRETAKRNPTERRLLVTVPVLLHLITADKVLHLANRFGRGI